MALSETVKVAIGAVNVTAADGAGAFVGAAVPVAPYSAMFIVTAAA